MWNEIFANLWVISIFAIILACLIAANVISGLYYSIGAAGQAFSLQKLVLGLLKGLVVLIASYLIAVALTAVPYAIAASGIALEQSVLDSVSIIVLFLIWGWAIIKYGLAAIENLRKIFGVSISNK